MKTAVGVIATTMITAMVATDAAAEWRLYVNRDNKAWSLERSYVSNDECDRAARTLYRSGQALGVGCAEYPAPSAAQTQAPRPAEYSRSNPAAQRQLARAEEPARVSASRSSAPRGAEYPARSTALRQAPVVERVSDHAAAVQSHPAAVIFPPSGGIEVRSDAEVPAPAVVASRPAPEPRRQAAPVVAQRNTVAQINPEDDKSSAAVALAKAAAEATAAAAREAEAEATKREAVVTADKSMRRTQLAIFGGVALVIGTGLAYSVYRVARTSPLRALAVGLMELGLLTVALAYPVAELWTRLKIAESMVLSWLPGLLAGLFVAGVGVIVLALELTRKPTRPVGHVGAGAPGRDAAPAKPIELIKPGEHVKTGEPDKEPVRPLQPVRPLEPVKPLESAKPFEPVKPADAPAPIFGGA